MENGQNDREYQANNADAVVEELFSGGITVEESIERLRTRLLDLSARNRLLNYRHPKGRCIQIADEPNLNLVFDRMYVDTKGILFKHVPEPSPYTYEGKRPEAKLHATSVGISTSFDFSPNPTGSNGRRLHGIQTLFYPDDLERKLRKIASEAKTAIEETGTNMLFLIFGFLEFYDSEDSQRAMLAPIISLPVTLVRDQINKETHTYQYTVQHNGEDLAENYTLREKLRRDFMLSIPEFGEEEEPESYFTRFEQVIMNKRRWRIRRQITLGMLSFGKLAIWADLDTKKNPHLTEHNLIKSIFSAGSKGEDSGLYAKDYHIDDRPGAEQTLIYDADSSQHSAIIDVLSGKNLVINGPPGTGKSQTITNIIAAALSNRKKVLFVSEKLAALEVVRRRLNHAGLGHFCLELHSHKTQKKKFLEDINSRIEHRFLPVPQFQDKLTILHRKKIDLARHAELMGSCVHNSLGLTVNDVFWAAERRRQELGDLSAEVNAIGFPDASHWTHDDIESRRSRLTSLSEIYDVIDRFDALHPWWGFQPESLAPSDDETIDRTIQLALNYARNADAAAEEIVEFFNLKGQPDVEEVSNILAMLDRVPPLPDGAETALLPKMFDPESDPKGQRSSRLLSDVSAGVTKIRLLLGSASHALADHKRLPPEEIAEIRRIAEKRKLSSELLTTDFVKALQTVARLEEAVESFAMASRVSSAPYGPADKAALDSFLSNCKNPAVSGLGAFSIRSLSECTARVLETAQKLSGAVFRIRAITTRRNLQFDTTPDSVARLAGPAGLTGLAKEVRIDEKSLAQARRYAAIPLSNKPIVEIGRLKSLLDAEVLTCKDALTRCRQAAEMIGLAFDSTDRAVSEIEALAKVAAAAPIDLLEYRRTTFGHERTVELIEKMRSVLAVELEGKVNHDRLFYLDALPVTTEIKTAVAVLRSKDGFFAFLDGDWRKARRLHTGLSKEKRKVSGKQRAEELVGLASWIEIREAFVLDVELKESFGRLFRGLETDLEKITRLNDWYLFGRTALAECPGLSDNVDLTAIPPEKFSELASKSDAVIEDAKRIAGAEAAVRKILNANIAGFREAKTNGWDAALDCISRAAKGLGIIFNFFARHADKDLSPNDALLLMEARAELDNVSSEFTLLLEGERALREAGGDGLGHLADLTKGPWIDVIPAISAQASIVAEIASQALTFAGEEVYLSVAETFARSKTDMDEAWSAVSFIPAWSHFDCWSSLLDVARDDVAATRRILERLYPCAKPGISAEEIFVASVEEAEAQSTLALLTGSNDIIQLMGDTFKGANTDLDSLSKIHAWGDTICTLGLPSSIRRCLLSEDTRYALDKAQNLYKTAEAGCCNTRKSMENLSSFGSFSWDEWQKQARTVSDRDLPSEIRTRLEVVVGMPRSILPWSKYLLIREQAKQEGLEDFVNALESGRIPSRALASAFELATFQSIGRSIYRAYPELSRFDGSAHEKTRSDYRALDTEIISLTGKDFASQIEQRTRAPEGQRGTTVGEYTEMYLLRREINKQRRHIPIRQLLKRAGNALQELKPCFMMGPLSVARYLEQGSLQFDLVVMDEASQLRPEEALGAIARGTQLVVVGDPKQLPPTSFFDRMLDVGDDEEEDEAPAAISGMESILDICQQLFTPVRSLRWHYRSHHESLIAFSNFHFYKNLIVFPSPYSKIPSLGVKYRYVRAGLYKDRQNVPEAQRIVDAVLEHMIKRPNESLGVVTLNQTQRELIEELLDKKLKTFEEGANFMGRWETEGWPFFVKNLENVQGDERDVIFISTTFGKAPGTNKIRQNFGPISRPDGWRRLNVLFTRSRHRIELFTSMAPEDLVIDERTPLGTKALRDYLDFAKRGVLVTTDEGEREPDSDFEVSVANVVKAEGYQVKPQLGVAGFFIDMAVHNPDRPGEFLAGIECDGATYHSGFSVRDRDRIRQEILESLGWQDRIHRIWSTDWFYNPRRETERLRNFLKERRRLSALEDSEIWEEEDYNEVTGNETDEKVAEELAEVMSASAGNEDLFVEVGDQVTYCPMDAPNDRHIVIILESPSNVKKGIVNEQTPLAQALLGLSPGDVGEMEVPGQRKRLLRVLKVQRQKELAW